MATVTGGGDEVGRLQLATVGGGWRDFLNDLRPRHPYYKTVRKLNNKIYLPKS